MPEPTERELESEVDLVVFERGGRRYAADALEVVRVSRAGDGEQSDRTRSLVVLRGGAEARVPIEKLIGVRRVSRRALRPLPLFLRGLLGRELIGFALEGEEIMLLVDLEALVDEMPRASAKAGNVAA